VGIGTFDNFLQTEHLLIPVTAAALVNINGDVYRHKSAIYSQTGGSVGIGCAIPINMAKDLLPCLKQAR
jgi:serine protease Do